MKRKSDKSLTNKLDDLFRKLMRLKKPRTDCFVCHRQVGYFSSKTEPYGLQVGHFVSRSVFALRWDLENCEYICSGCNKIHEQNILPHTYAIVKEYGEEFVDRLNVKWQLSKQKDKTFSRAEKLEMIEKFEAELEAQC